MTPTPPSPLQVAGGGAALRHLEALQHRLVEGAGEGIAPRARFSWSERTVAATRERAVEYRDTVSGGWSQRLVTWRPRGWDWEIRLRAGLWTVRELTSSTELAEESRAMHHCVASYAYRCAQGSSAIFVASDLSGYVTGTITMVDGGYMTV